MESTACFRAACSRTEQLRRKTAILSSATCSVIALWKWSPATGRVVRVVLDKINGKPIDGPNDLVMDAKGGIYITDPQFTPEAQKSQPGKQVYYVAPDGTAKVVIGPGEYAMPNGVELSPDGKTLYVNNTWQKPGENLRMGIRRGRRWLAFKEAAICEAGSDDRSPECGQA